MRAPLILALLAAAALPALDADADAARRARAAMTSPSEEQRVQAVIGLGVICGPATTLQLADALRDGSASVRTTALESLRRRPADLLRPLVRRLAEAREPSGRSAACALAMRALGDDAIGLLAGLLGDRDPQVRFAAARALRELPCPAVPAGRAAWLAAWQEVLDGGTLAQKREAVAALAGLAPSAQACAALRALLRRQPEEIADLACAQMLALAPADEAFPRGLGRQLVQDGAPANRVLAANALLRVGTATAAAILVDGLEAGQGGKAQWEVRAAIADAIGTIAPADARVSARCEAALLRLLDDDQWGVRMAAFWALGRLGSAAAIPAAIDRLAGRREKPFLARLLQGWTGMRHEGIDEWRAWLEQNRKAPAPARGGALPATSTVSFFSLGAEAASVAYVLDVSGSMGEAFPNDPAYAKSREVPSKLEAAKRELWRSVGMLHPPSRLSLITFASAVNPWGDGSLVAGWRARARLWETIEAIRPAGGTNAQGALRAAVDLAGCDTAFFLTDGMPTVGESTDPARILLDIGERNQARSERLRLNAIAFLVPEAEPFLSQLAAANGGAYALQR